jgi:hypothetical protein
MTPEPADEMRGYTGRGLLDGRRALVTGGDSGIGRAVTIAFAKEGADVAITYLSEAEDADARHTAELVRAVGHRCTTIRTDLAVEDNCVPMGRAAQPDEIARPTFSSPRPSCPATTPAMCWRPSAARRCPADSCRRRRRWP